MACGGDAPLPRALRRNHLWFAGRGDVHRQWPPNDIGPGQTCFIPCGAVHGFDNLKPVTAKALTVVTPALIGPEFFKEMAAIVNASGPPDLEKINTVMAKHRLVPAMPPGAS